MEKMGFLAWLHKQRRQQTPLGDLARDMLDDSTFPGYPVEAKDEQTVLQVLHRYMRWECQACEEALDALHEAWCQYTKQGIQQEWTWRCFVCYEPLWPHERQETSILWPSRHARAGYRFDALHTSCLTENYLEEWEQLDPPQQYLPAPVLLATPTLPIPALAWRRICAFYEHEDMKQRPPKGRRPLTHKERWAIFMRDGFRCQACGAHKDDGPQVRLHVDHKLAIMHGGTNDPSNLWTLCAACNSGKGTQAP